MALESGVGQPSAPPIGSGRSSPAPRTARKAAEEGIFKADKSLRKYGAAIERALASWEISPEEWADYIAFLGRLLKTIQTHPKDAPILPHSDGIAYMLAQCLNPALPSGVHQKALEIYDYIFSTFRHTWIAEHLHEFFPGLSAVLSFASLSVRPLLYSLYDEYFLFLSPVSLRPILKSLILSLLPGLEDETGEDFERAFQLFEGFESLFSATHDDETNADGYFWQCLFLAIISNPSRRQGALNYLAHKLPKFAATSKDAAGEMAKSTNGTTMKLSPEAEVVVIPEPGLLIRAFVCGLSDSQLLIQRGFLDLLVTHLPLDSPLLQDRVGEEDLDRITLAAMHVLLRRDMSLNRRLWAWFLGSETKPETAETLTPTRTMTNGGSSEDSGSAQHNYFTLFGKETLTRCALAMFKQSGLSAVERARPFRICFSLMDRWEVGGSVVPQLFLAAIESVYRYSLVASADDTAEVLRSASLFFDGVEASLIWANLTSLLRSCLIESPDSDGFQVLTWTIQKFNIKDEEMLMIHIPYAACYTLTLLEHAPEKSNLELKAAAWDVVSLLLELIPDRAFSQSQGKPTSNRVTAGSIQESQGTIKSIEQFYEITNISFAAPFDGPTLALMLSQSLATHLLHAIEGRPEVDFNRITRSLLTFHSKSTSPVTLGAPELSHALYDMVDSATSGGRLLAFSTLSSTLSLMKAFDQRSGPLPTKNSILSLEPLLFAQFWIYLSPTRPKYHVEAVKSIWQLQDAVAPNDSLQASLTTAVRRTDDDLPVSGGKGAEGIKRFTVLWDHTVTVSQTTVGPTIMGSSRRISSMPNVLDPKQSRRRQKILAEPLMIVIDMLEDARSDSLDAIRSWLQNTPTLRIIFDIYLDMLAPLAPLANGHTPINTSLKRRHTEQKRHLEYILGHLQTMLQIANEKVWQCLDDASRSSQLNQGSLSGTAALAECCIGSLCSKEPSMSGVQRKAVAVLGMILSGPSSSSLEALNLASRLTDLLAQLLYDGTTENQDSILRLLTRALRLPAQDDARLHTLNGRPSSSTDARKPPAVFSQSSPTTSSTSLSAMPPAQLLNCLQLGLTLGSSSASLDHWTSFLSSILPVFADAIFANLLPLVGSLCAEINKAYEVLTAIAKENGESRVDSPEAAAIALLDALEAIISHAHTRLAGETVIDVAPKVAAQSRSLLGNVAAGVFKADAPATRNAQTNNRLTVVLAYQDAVRVAFRLWTWAIHSSIMEDFDKASAGTTSYNALRVRSRTRLLLEHTFEREPLESLEVIAATWHSTLGSSESAVAALDLLHVLQGMRPKVVVPIILDALNSRTNSATLPFARQSCQATALTALDVAIFLKAYLESTEDDAMDEVWPDCMAFLKDVVSNPLPYRQVLPTLLSIVLLLGQKVENTNFGEQRKMRRELGDIFVRLLTATLTAMSSGGTETQINSGNRESTGPGQRDISLAGVLKEIIENIEIILDSSDKATTVINTITTNLISPLFHSKAFPTNVTPDALALLLQMARKAPSAKLWKKELFDVFNDPKLLLSSPENVQSDWAPILRQWCTHDTERMPEMLSRLIAPSSAGIMFGVGASAARLDADRKAQLNLRRVCILLLSCVEDAFVGQLRPIEEKLVELFEASPSSSPSSAIKSELFMVCRALVLSVNAAHLAPLWPLLNHTIQSALLSVLPNSSSNSTFSNLSLLQASKLLDLLLAASPDDFQLHEWLYVSDTTDAIYQPPNWTPAALSDQIAESLSSEGPPDVSSPVTPTAISSGITGRRRPLLDNRNLPNKNDIKAMSREDFAGVVLRPFFSQLSLHAYEGFYSMETPDLSACRRSLLEDILDMSTIVE